MKIRASRGTRGVAHIALYLGAHLASRCCISDATTLCSGLSTSSDLGALYRVVWCAMAN